jgi:hypothetical protein
MPFTPAQARDSPPSQQPDISDDTSRQNFLATVFSLRSNFAINNVPIFDSLGHSTWSDFGLQSPHITMVGCRVMPSFTTFALLLNLVGRDFLPAVQLMAGIASLRTSQHSQW